MYRMTQKLLYLKNFDYLHHGLSKQVHFFVNDRGILKLHRHNDMLEKPFVKYHWWSQQNIYSLSKHIWNKLYCYIEASRNVWGYDNLQNNLSHKVQRHKHHTDNVYRDVFLSSDCKLYSLSTVNILTHYGSSGYHNLITEENKELKYSL